MPGTSKRLSGSVLFTTNQLIYRYVFQEETGEGGTGHLQGVFNAKNQIAFSTVKQWNLRLHIEATRDIHLSVQYCSDPEKRSGRIWCNGFNVETQELGILEPASLFEWQMECLSYIQGPPDPRRVRWYYDPDGGCGKTELARYLIARRGAFFLASAKGADMCHQIIKSRSHPKIVCINLTRASEGAFSYSTIESIKDGLVFSGKYEGGVRLFPKPHLVIFANWYPDLTKLTTDRWQILTLRNNPPRVVLTDNNIQ